MTVRREQDVLLDTLFADYAKGNLPHPVRILVDAHLQMTDANHDWVHGLETLVAGDMHEGDPASLTNASGMLNAILNSVPSENVAEVQAEKSDAIAPQAIRELIGKDVDAINWRMKLPGFHQYKLDDIDGCEVSLFKIKAGQAIPTHTHHGSEFTLVLCGGFSDARGHYVAGDISVADEAVDHRPVADTDGDCIGFAVTDAPVKLTGPIGRIFSSLMSSN